MRSFIIPRCRQNQSVPQIYRIPLHTLSKFWHDYMERLLEHDDVLVANPDDDDLYILGYLVMESGLPFFCYTRELARRKGVASALMGYSGASTTARTRFSTGSFARFVRSLPPATGVNTAHLAGDMK